MKKLLLIAAASATILSSTLSFADGMDDNQWYLKANAGATMFNETKDKTITPNLKMKSNTSFIGEIGVGYYIMENVRTDLTLAMVSNAELKKTFTENVSSNVSETLKVKHKPQIGSLLVNGYVDFVDVGMFKLFGGAGIGTALIKEKITDTYTITVTTGNQVLPSKTTSQSTKKTYNFAYQVSLGASAEVADGVKAELVYSYRDYGKTKTKKIVDPAGDTLTYGGTRYKGNNIMAGIRFDI